MTDSCLQDWLAALREGAAPPDAYVFQNVSGEPTLTTLQQLPTKLDAPAAAPCDATVAPFLSPPGFPALPPLGVCTACPGHVRLTDSAE